MLNPSKFTKILVSIFIVVLLSSCSMMKDRDRWTDRGALDTRLIIEYLLADMPLPPDSDILEEKTVIQGSGQGWSGKMTFLTPLSPAELMIFFYENIATAGWDLISSTISEQIILVYKRGYRIATVEILRDYPMFGRQTTGIISVVPDDAVASNPFNQYKLNKQNPD